MAIEVDDATTTTTNNNNIEYRHRPSLMSVSSSIPRNESSSSSLRSESAFDVDARPRGSSGSSGSLSF